MRRVENLNRAGRDVLKVGFDKLYPMWNDEIIYAPPKASLRPLIASGRRNRSASGIPTKFGSGGTCFVYRNKLSMGFSAPPRCIVGFERTDVTAETSARDQGGLSLLP